MAADVWTRLAAERAAARDYFTTLEAADWAAPSLCGGWSNRDALAHLVAGAKSTPRTFITRFVGSGFNFDKFIAKGLAIEAGRTPAELLADWGTLVPRHTQPSKAMVGEAIVHAEDIRYAVGRGTIAHDPDNVRFVADTYVSSGAPIRGKNRAAGLKLVATDTTWSHGDGPVVEGPILAIVMAIAGRRAAHAELAGDGVSTLAAKH